MTGVRLPESNAYETVAGLLISLLGRMPENHDTVVVTATMDAAAELGVRQGQAGAHPDDEPIQREENDDVPRAVVVRLPCTSVSAGGSRPC